MPNHAVIAANNVVFGGGDDGRNIYFCHYAIFRYGLCVMIKKEFFKSYARIFVEDMVVEMRIGFKVSERKPQRVKVCVELFTDAVKYLNSVDQSSIIDYAVIWEAVRQWPGREHQDLIEPYLRELLDLAFGFDRVSAAKVSLSKLDIFPEAQGAGVEVFMTRRNYKRLKKI